LVAVPKDKQWVVLERARTVHVDEKEKPGWVYVLNKGLNATPDGFIIGSLLLPFLVSSSCIYVMYTLLQLRLSKKSNL
jgi:hypothetical protein